MERILKHIRILRRGTQPLHSQQKAVRCRLRTLKHFSGENHIHQLFQLRMRPIDILHLGLVGRSHNGRLHPVAAQIEHETQGPGNILIHHFLFKRIQLTHNFLLHLGAVGKIRLKDLRQRLPLDTAAEILDTQILFSLLIPKKRVLRFSVHHHTVQVEQHRLCLHLLHPYIIIH